jgi:hypothetical protein
MNEHDWNYEALTEEEARLRHPDCEMIRVFSIVDRTVERRPAIFVFRTEEFTEATGFARSEEDDDGKEPEAVYWLKSYRHNC